MNTIKHTLLGLLLTFIVMSCQEESVAPEVPVGEGQLTMTTKMMERKVYQLSNTSNKSKAGKATFEERYHIYNSENNAILQDLNPKEQSVITLPVGAYRVHYFTFNSDKPSIVTSVGSHDFTIEQGKLLELEVMMLPLHTDIGINLTDLPDAKVWLGPAGFVPSEAYVYTDAVRVHIGSDDMEFDNRIVSEGFYPVDYMRKWDIVVEFQGEQKRYEMDVRFCQVITVNIARNDEEEPIEQQGNVKAVSSYFLDETPVSYEFVW